MHTFKRFGIEARVFNNNSADDLENLIDGKTRAIFFETLSNPQIAIPNFKKIVEIADKHGDLPILNDGDQVTLPHVKDVRYIRIATPTIRCCLCSRHVHGT